MASNFHVSISQKNNTLHLKLKGDFDGTSAFELIDILRKTNRNGNKIMIHTENLDTVYPFGIGVFTNNLPAQFRDVLNPVFSHNHAAVAA